MFDEFYITSIKVCAWYLESRRPVPDCGSEVERAYKRNQSILWNYLLCLNWLFQSTALGYLWNLILAVAKAFFQVVYDNFTSPGIRYLMQIHKQ
jgi:hypothetical protein